MNRVALDLGVFQIYWYSLFILLGILVALGVILKEIKKNNFDKDKFIDMAIYAIIIGIIGARVYYVIFNFSYYINNPLEIIEIYKGGLAIHGGIIAGCLYIIYYTRKNKIDTLKILDMVVVGLIIAQAIGRWGNFFNKEAYGVVTTYSHLKSLLLPDFIINGMKIDGNYYTPTFLYESIWNVIGFIILLLIRNNKNVRIGQLSGIYLVWYSLGRFFIESMRLDSLMIGSFRMAMIMSTILFIIGVILIVTGRNRNLYNKK